ncbi:abortive infection system antitoxin AbiGi family protein [Flavobacterium mesophilum]|uniref:abortive infection system antitoxin AbiGi family protein n=1 Tax=Flavobacterium mesophilum TaxID=3143495 RepID=UPI0031D3C003
MPNNSLHPNILFHFTNKVALFGILRDTFKISYAREQIIGPKNRKEFAVPMVSFCDLKLSELKKFIDDDYGKYGIGLTKEWANRNNLNPVMYISRHCNVTDNLINGIEGIYRHLNSLNSMEEITRLGEDYKNIIDIYRYIKNYDGELKRKNKPLEPNYRFADDREWRYVPNINTININPFIPISRIRTSEQKQQLNATMNHLGLNFQPEDIKYLIVEKEEEIIELINHLESVKGRFDIQTRRRLSSRILTIEQIQNDI